MIKLLLITTLFNFNLATDTVYYKDTVTVNNKKLASALKKLWDKNPLPYVKTPVIIYEPKEKLKKCTIKKYN